MTNETFIEERRTGLGGSDAGAVCGVSKWSTPYEVYQQKLGLLTVEDNPAMEWGRRLEPVIRQKYSDETGIEVIVPGDKLFRHPKYPFMIAHVDGLPKDRVLEVKTARSVDGWGEEGSDEIPINYMFQIQHYMSVVARPLADVAVLIGGSDFRIYNIEADKELQEMIIEQEADFWEKVKTQTPPEPVSLADILARYKIARNAPITADNAVIEAIEGLRQVKLIEDQCKASKEAHEAVVKGFMGEFDTLMDANGEIITTWKQSKGRTAFDGKAFQIDQPELYKQYMKTGEPGRRFLVKKAREE